MDFWKGNMRFGILRVGRGGIYKWKVVDWPAVLENSGYVL